MARTLLAPLGLVSVTTTQRDALGTQPDGSAIYNQTVREVQVMVNGSWESLELSAAAEVLIDALIVEVARHRQAFLFLGLDVNAFDPELVPL